METIKEKELKTKPIAVTFECNEIIMEQMKKNICKIKMKDGSQGTGFFCKIPFPNRERLLPVLITNNHVINQYLLQKENENVSLIIKEEKKVKVINLSNRMKYTNPDYDITILELKEEKDDIKNFLELDDIILENILDSNINVDSNQVFIGETMYIIQYPEGKLSVSYGILNLIYEDKKYNFNHFCSTKKGSSGSPILNIATNKIIGIHKESSEVHNFNRGTFLNYPIKEFIMQNYQNQNIIQNINNQENNTTFNININNNNLFPFIGMKNTTDNGYLNSTLQCLLHIPELNNFFINVFPKQKQNFKNINKNSETKGIISEAYFNIIFDVFNKAKIFDKNTVKNNTYIKITTKAFEDNLMKLKNEFIDSKDFLLFLLQSLHDELNYYGNKKIVKHPKSNQFKKAEAFDFFMKVYNDTNLSILSYNFYGISMQETECLSCHHILYNFQFFQIITFD